jgi:hypothetical protein
MFIYIIKSVQLRIMVVALEYWEDTHTSSVPKLTYHSNLLMHIEYMPDSYLQARMCRPNMLGNASPGNQTYLYLI